MNDGVAPVGRPATTTMSWRDEARDDAGRNDDDEPPTLSFGAAMSDGDMVEVTVDAEPELVDTGHSNKALRFELTFEAHVDGEATRADDDGGGTFDAGETAVGITWSNRFKRSFAGLADKIDGVVGETVRVHKTGEGVNTHYNVVETPDE